MKSCAIALSVCLICGSASPAFADFQYTTTSKITGGSLYGAMKFASMFNKKVAGPQTQTHYLKGNKMRTEGSDGKVEIIDLDAKQFIHIDPAKKTYSVMTFEQMRQALENAKQRAKEKAAENGQDPNSAKTKVTVTPKVEVTPGTDSRVILGQQTSEVKSRVEMQMQAQSESQTTSDPQSGNVDMIMTSDQWIAPNVAGYKEVTEFHVRLGKELSNYMKDTFVVDPRMAQGMEEMRKSGAIPQGLPMLQYTSMSMAGQGNNTASSNGSQSAQQDTSSTKSNSGDIPTSTSGAVVKGLGSLFSKKKKKDDTPPADASNTSGSSAPPPPASNPNSLMDMTIEVTSFSANSLDSNLFTIPAGYTQVQEDPNMPFGGKPAKK